MKNINVKKHHKGFSLIELVIVVAIIGILALMIIPQFSNVTEDARVKTWNANCQTVVSAISMYQAGHNGEYPPDTDALAPYLNGGWDSLKDAPRGADYDYSLDPDTMVGTFIATYDGVEDYSFQYPTDATNPTVPTGGGAGDEAGEG